MATRPTDRKPLSLTVRAAREAAGLSPAALAAACETTTATIRGIEDGVFEPRDELLDALVAVLKLDVPSAGDAAAKGMAHPAAKQPVMVTISADELAFLRAELHRNRSENRAAHEVLDRMGIERGGRLADRIVELDERAPVEAAEFLATATCPNCTRTTVAAAAPAWGASFAGQGWGAAAAEGC